MIAEPFMTVTPVHGDRVTVAVRGELDLTTAERLRKLLRGALEGHRELRVDLSGVTFFDCAGLSALLSVRRDGVRTGRRMLLCDVPPPVAKVLRATGVEPAFGLEPGPARAARETDPAPRPLHDDGGRVHSA